MGIRRMTDAERAEEMRLQRDESKAETVRLKGILDKAAADYKEGMQRLRAEAAQLKQERDNYRGMWRDSQDARTNDSTIIEMGREERDEARAEAERLRTRLADLESDALRVIDRVSTGNGHVAARLRGSIAGLSKVADGCRALTREDGDG